MGIIAKQSIKGTIYTYIGIVLGFIINIFIFAKFLSQEEIGFLGFIIKLVLVCANFASLGFNSVTTRLFTYFRNQKEKHQGFLSLNFIIHGIGFFIFTIIFLALEPVFFKKYENSPLFLSYFYYIIPFVFFYLFFNALDNYNKVLYDVISGVFLKEILSRILVLIAVINYYFEIISFHQFVISYMISYSLPSLILALILIKRNQFHLFAKIKPIPKEMQKNMKSVSLFGWITGLSSIAIISVDTLMLGAMTSASMLGIYSITFYFGSVIAVPSRALLKITSSVIADAWKNNDLKTIQVIYEKSSLNQTFIAFWCLIGIWINIDNIFKIIVGYDAGKYVILFIGISNVIVMTAGANTSIISTSKYYKMQTFLIIALIFLLIFSNLIFIPIYGIVGAAFASMLSNLIFNAFKYWFLYKKFNMQIFNYKYILILLNAVVSYFIVYFLPSCENVYVDIFIKSMLISIIYFSITYFLKISEEFNKKIKKILYLF